MWRSNDGKSLRRLSPLCYRESGVKRYWEIIADELSKAGFSWGCSSEIDSTGRVIFTADGYARDGRRFTVLADEIFNAFWDYRELQVSRWATG
jgi:hypothetical protein